VVADWCLGCREGVPTCPSAFLFAKLAIADVVTNEGIS
jgi:hypothetical protein